MSTPTSPVTLPVATPEKPHAPFMRQYELVERVRSYNPHCDEDLLNRAYIYAMQAHSHQKRASGDPYFMHPLEVAAILTDLKLDDATIVAAVLHDTIEDTHATREEIDRLFGAEIGALVEGLTKIKKLDFVSKKATQGENFRKLLLAIAEDVRVMLVKLADRLHNMRTLHHVPPEKRVRISEETLEIYAPLAGRMGMQDMREELEDLSFRNIKPDAYATIVEHLDKLETQNVGLIGQIERELAAKLSEKPILAEIKGRRKQPYSIWKKMERKSISFEQLSDIFGFRILVNTLDECYRVLGVVHTTWPMVPGRYKDYISTPKQNDYKSIHTTVVGPGHQRVELQIRTYELNQIAEQGIAAHALYKDATTTNGGSPLTETGAYRWLRHTVDMLAEGDNPEEFLEHTKLELFQDQVFCFTPKGLLIALPRGATPIDFAYAVHTRVGHSAVGCKINGHVAPLLSQLQNGDEVEIIRSEAQTPPSAWEGLVVTGKARAAIRRATRAAVQRQYAGLGRQILTRAFERAEKLFSEDKLKAALPRLARTGLDDVFAAVGRGEMFSGDVVKALYPDYTQSEKTAAHSVHSTPKRRFGETKGGESVVINGSEDAEKAKKAIPIRGINRDLPIFFAPNGGAVPGDRIVGILNPGVGITIYPIQSPSLAAFENVPEHWLDVRWDIEDRSSHRFPARLLLKTINEPGTLAQISQIIADHDGNIDNISMKRNTSDYSETTIDLSVWDLKHLNAIIAELRVRSVVSKIERYLG
jgi:GTP diphosphokinase / guanosine-3',5'-bis(diphosphate) 3'-diphosphatase